MKKSVIILLFLVLMICVTASVFLQETHASEEFAGGLGTSEDPYLIETVEQLDNIRNHLDKHFRQVNDIDLGLAPWNSDSGWEPIGSLVGEGETLDFDFDHEDSFPFTGSYDGDGFVIKNLTINRPGEEYVGLFACAQGATFMNVSLENISINTGGYCGGLAGIIKETGVVNSNVSGNLIADSWRTNAGGLIGYAFDESTIANCHSSVDVDGTGGNRYLGGLVGVCYKSDIDNCSATGSVSGVWWVGGLVGSFTGLNEGVLSSSYASGPVTGTAYYAGGLVGSNHTALIKESHSTGPVVGQHSVGGLAGFNTAAVIEDSYATGSVTATGYNVGGLVGGSRLSESLIDRSYATGLVSAEGNRSYNIGGLVGFNHQGADINQCYALGSVYGNSTVGGLVGRNGLLSTENTFIKDSYASGTVSGFDNVGGLAGINVSKINNSYAVGAVIDYAENAGGLVGISYQSGSTGEPVIIASYYNSDLTNHSNSNYGEAKTTMEMISSVTYEEWNFSDTWLIDEGISYPYHTWQQDMQPYNRPQPYGLTGDAGNLKVDLSWQPPFNSMPDGYNIYRDGVLVGQTDLLVYSDENVDNYQRYQYKVTAIYNQGETAYSNAVYIIPNTGFAGGTGSVDDPFLVSSAEHLFNVRCIHDAYYQQVANISLNDYTGPLNMIAFSNDGGSSEGWLPIGDNTLGGYFSGHYDGNGYEINDLFIDRIEDNNIGLFGYLRGAILNNIKLKRANVTGNERVGMLAGQVHNSSIINNCHASGVVSGSNTVGGLIGSIEDSIIEKSSTAGDVVGFKIARFDGNIVGGLIGASKNSTIENSYSTSNTVGRRRVGGLLGDNNDGGTVKNSYAVGSVEGDESVGGLVGLEWRVNVSKPAITINSYYDTETTGQNDNTGKGTPKSTIDMKNGTPSADIFSDWPEDVWIFTAGQYPLLTSLDQPPTWRSIAVSDAQALAYDGGVLAASVEGFGIGIYDGNDWANLTSATALALATDGSTLVASVEGFGIWAYDGDWSQLTPFTADLLAVDNGMIAASFADHGIWLFDGNGWTNLTPAPARALAFDGGRLVASVEGFGTWLNDGISWTQLTPETAQHLAISGGNIAASFAGLGIWYSEDHTWDNLTAVPARALALSSGVLATSVDGFGTWLNDGEWSNILAAPADLLALDDGKVAASFEGQGIWLYE